MGSETKTLARNPAQWVGGWAAHGSSALSLSSYIYTPSPPPPFYSSSSPLLLRPTHLSLPLSIHAGQGSCHVCSRFNTACLQGSSDGWREEMGTVSVAVERPRPSKRRESCQEIRSVPPGLSGWVGGREGDGLNALLYTKRREGRERGGGGEGRRYWWVGRTDLDAGNAPRCQCEGQRRLVEETKKKKKRRRRRRRR